jgi:hypothetical protein
MVEILEGNASIKLATGPTEKRGETRTRIQWLSFDTSSPAAAIVPTWNFNELCRQLDVVVLILQNLNTTVTSIELGPSVALESITLLARMSRTC